MNPRVEHDRVLDGVLIDMLQRSVELNKLFTENESSATG